MSSIEMSCLPQWPLLKLSWPVRFQSGCSISRYASVVCSLLHMSLNFKTAAPGQVDYKWNGGLNGGGLFDQSLYLLSCKYSRYTPSFSHRISP